MGVIQRISRLFPTIRVCDNIRSNANEVLSELNFWEQFRCGPGQGLGFQVYRGRRLCGGRRARHGTSSTRPVPQHLTERVPCSVEPGKLYNLQFRAEAFNMPNHPVFDRPAFSNLGDAAWGKITGLATQMRQIQFALKLLF